MQPTATVFFLHGLGDTGFGWSPVFEDIAAPQLKYVLPHAPSRAVTLNGGMLMPAW
jgi:predicted esterase